MRAGAARRNEMEIIDARECLRRKYVNDFILALNELNWIHLCRTICSVWEHIWRGMANLLNRFSGEWTTTIFTSPTNESVLINLKRFFFFSLFRSRSSSDVIDYSAWHCGIACASHFSLLSAWQRFRRTTATAAHISSSKNKKWISIHTIFSFICFLSFFPQFVVAFSRPTLLILLVSLYIHLQRFILFVPRNSISDTVSLGIESFFLIFFSLFHKCFSLSAGAFNILYGRERRWTKLKSRNSAAKRKERTKS